MKSHGQRNAHWCYLHRPEQSFSYDKSYSLIIEKLPDFGITGIQQQWIGSYLFGRYQQVSCGGLQLSQVPLFCGVSQSSILGPFLFLLHFNDSENVLSKLYFTKYTDDTLYFIIHTKIIEIENVMSFEFKVDS